MGDLSASPSWGKLPLNLSIYALLSPSPALALPAASEDNGEIPGEIRDKKEPTAPIKGNFNQIKASKYAIKKKKKQRVLEVSFPSEASFPSLEGGNSRWSLFSGITTESFADSQTLWLVLKERGKTLKVVFNCHISESEFLLAFWLSYLGTVFKKIY